MAKATQVYKSYKRRAVRTRSVSRRKRSFLVSTNRVHFTSVFGFGLENKLF